MSDPFEVELQIGTIERAEKFAEARKEKMVKLWIEIGDSTYQSAAQLGHNYEVEDLEGRQVLCATNLGEINVGDFKSEVLTTGVPDKSGEVVLVSPDEEVPSGAKLF